MNGEKDLLFGVLAVQLGFATPRQVMACGAAWAADHSKGLPERLQEEGAIPAEKVLLLNNLVRQALESHGGDPRKTLASFGGGDAVLKSFGGSIQVSTQDEIVPARTGSGSLNVEPVEDDTLGVTAEHRNRYTFRAGDAEIGRGGIGKVLIAFDEHLGREIALKELLDDPATMSTNPGQTPLTRTSAAVVRFLREARVTGQLEHPNIVPVYEVGRRADGALYYTMKLVRGRTLADALKACDRLAERLGLLNHFVDLCQAVAYAHSRGVVHRDIKPENVMVGEFGETVVLDWGLAKVRGEKDLIGSRIEREIRVYQEGAAGKTMDGSAIGTPAYMSPEQAEGDVDQIDERSDVWGLGAVLFEILTGRPPFEGVTPFEIVGKVMRGKAPPVKTVAADPPPELAAVADKALKHKRRHRYQTAGELARDVEAFRGGSRVAAYEYGSWELLWRFIARHRLLAVSTMLGAVFLIVGFVLLTRAYQDSEAARTQATTSERRAHLNLSRGYQRIAERYTEEHIYLGARVFAAAATLHNPYNPHSPYAFPQGWVVDENRRMEEIAALQSSLYLPRVLGGLLTFERAIEHDCPSVERLRFSAEGRRLAFRCDGKAVVLWDLSTKSESSRFAVEMSRWTGLAYAPTGDALAVPTSDNTIQVFHPSRGDKVFALAGHQQVVWSVDFSPDGALLASIGEDREVKIWDVDRRLVWRSLSLQGQGSDVVFSPEDPFIAYTEGRTVQIYDYEREEKVDTYSGPKHQVWRCAFSSDGRYIAGGGWEGSIWIWDVDTSELIWMFQAHQGPVDSLAWTPDNRYLISVGSLHDTLQVWSVFEQRPAARIEFSSRFHNMALAPDGDQLATVDGDNRIRLWRVGSTAEVVKIGVQEGRIHSAAFSPDGKLLAAGSPGAGEGDIRLFDAATGELREQLHTVEERVHDLAFTVDGDRLVSAGLRSGLTLWEVDTREEIRKFASPVGPVYTVAMNPTGGSFAAGGEAGEVWVYELSRTAPVARLTTHEGPVADLAFSPDGRWIGSAGHDGVVRLWDWRGDEGGKSVVLAGHTNWVTGVAFSPDGGWVATASKDGTAKLWNAATGEVLRELHGHEAWVNKIAFSPDGRLLLTGGDDATARLWDARTGRLVQVLKSDTPVFELGFSPDGKRFFINERQRAAIYPVVEDLWRTDPEDLLERAQREAGLRLEGFGLHPYHP